MHLYRDVEGDLWAFTDAGRVFLAVAPEHVWEGPATRTPDEVRDLYGPLVELSADEAPLHHRGLFDLFDRLTGLPDLPKP